MLRRSAFGLAVGIVVISGCGRELPRPEATEWPVDATPVVTGAAPTVTVAPSWSPADGLPTGLPVDPTLEPVSRSDPTPAAKAALDACVRPERLDAVVGMARLPARDVHRFSLTNGREPELQIDGYVWAIQFDGEFPSRRGGDLIDPLCVITPDGIRYLYGPYGRAGEPFTPPDDFAPPSIALPSLAP